MQSPLREVWLPKVPKVLTLLCVTRFGENKIGAKYLGDNRFWMDPLFIQHTDLPEQAVEEGKIWTLEKLQEIGFTHFTEDPAYNWNEFWACSPMYDRIAVLAKTKDWYRCATVTKNAGGRWIDEHGQDLTDEINTADRQHSPIESGQFYYWQYYPERFSVFELTGTADDIGNLPIYEVYKIAYQNPNLKPGSPDEDE